MGFSESNVRRGRRGTPTGGRFIRWRPNPGVDVTLRFDSGAEEGVMSGGRPDGMSEMVFDVASRLSSAPKLEDPDGADAYVTHGTDGRSVIHFPRSRVTVSPTRFGHGAVVDVRHAMSIITSPDMKVTVRGDADQVGRQCDEILDHVRSVNAAGLEEKRPFNHAWSESYVHDIAHGLRDA